MIPWTFVWTVTWVVGSAPPAGPEIITIAKADAQYVRHSEATVVELKDGRLLLAWIEFSKGQGDSDWFPARIVAKTSGDGGCSWEGHRVLAAPQPGELSTYSPNLLRLKDGRILFVCLRKIHFSRSPDVYPTATIAAYVSRDEGQTFTPLATICEKQPVGICNHTLKQLSTGRILLPVSRNRTKTKPEHWESGVAYSDDGGKTWTFSETWVDVPRRGAMEPHVEELGDGRVLMIMRTQMGTIWKSESSDGGKTWSRAESLGVESPESCPELVKVPKTGDLLLVWNAAKYDPKWASHYGKRTPLSVAISQDGGKTWSKPRHIETDPNRAYSNPAAYFTSQGKLLLTYWTCLYTPKGYMSSYPIDLKGAIVGVEWLYGDEGKGRDR